MEPMSYGKARAVVARYNSCRCARTASRELQVNYYDCFDLVDWLWNREYGTHDALIRRLPQNQAALPELTRPVWLEYLYTRNVTPEAAADSVDWHVNEVLRTCKGPQQWNRRKNRQPLGPPKHCGYNDDVTEQELPPEEIYRRAATLRSQRPSADDAPKPERVEVRRFSFKR